MLNLTDPVYSNEDKARAHLEALHWPNGPVCPHCREDKRVTKLTEEQLGVLLQKLGQPSEAEKKEIKPTPRWQYPAQQRQFHILDHLQVRRKTGRNWITRCPSCAAAGRDKSGDNLAISVDEPQKYICWAGCNKEMIRAALGCPIPEKRESAYAVG